MLSETKYFLNQFYSFKNVDNACIRVFFFNLPKVWLATVPQSSPKQFLF